jgi:DNA-binding response OmpR family regulator
MDSEAQNATRTILLAEDEETLRHFIGGLLQSNGYSVIIAVDGRDALEKSKAHAGKIDLLLSNIQMPGMTGIELATQLSLERPETKVLLISALPSGMLVLDQGWHFMPKPFLPNMLRAKIRTIFGEDKPEDIPDLREQHT